MIKSYEDNLVLDEECTGLKHENAELKEGLRLIERLVREKVGIPETKPLQETYSERARFTSELINDHLVKSQLQQRVPDGLEQAAQWVEQRLENYVEEHGYREQDTNAVVFPGDGADYVCELDEIAEGIRSLKESATQPPEPGQTIAEAKADAVRDAMRYATRDFAHLMTEMQTFIDGLTPQDQREGECCCGETEKAWRLCPEHGPQEQREGGK